MNALIAAQDIAGHHQYHSHSHQTQEMHQVHKHSGNGPRTSLSDTPLDTDKKENQPENIEKIEQKNHTHCHIDTEMGSQHILSQRREILDSQEEEKLQYDNKNGDERQCPLAQERIICKDYRKQKQGDIEGQTGLQARPSREKFRT